MTANRAPAPPNDATARKLISKYIRESRHDEVFVGELARNLDLPVKQVYRIVFERRGEHPR